MSYSLFHQMYGVAKVMQDLNWHVGGEEEDKRALRRRHAALVPGEEAFCRCCQPDYSGWQGPHGGPSLLLHLASGTSRAPQCEVDPIPPILL